MRIFKKSVLMILMVAVVVTACGGQQGGSSETEGTKEVEKPIFNSGDTITSIVPFSAGGGYDRVARLVQPYFEKELEQIVGNDINVIVTNITGAGGVNGYAKMFRSEPDGKTLGVLGLSAAPYQQLTTEQFDLSQFTYIAQVNTDPTALVVSKNSPINSFDDFVKRSLEKPILMGTSGKGASENMDALMTQALLEKNGQKLNVEFVHYQGTGPALLGIVKGEAEAMLVTESTAYQQVKNGDLKAIAIYSKERGAYLSDAQTLFEQNVPGAEELTNVIGMVRVIVGPPGIPENITKALRDAFTKALENPELITQGETSDICIEPGTGETAQATAQTRLENAKQYQDIVTAAFQ